jgi:segregation and condensation protein B
VPETAEELEPERHTHLPQADGSPDPVDDPLDDQLPDDDEPEIVEPETADEPARGESNDLENLMEEPTQ